MTRTGSGGDSFLGSYRRSLSAFVLRFTDPGAPLLATRRVAGPVAVERSIHLISLPAPAERTNGNCRSKDNSAKKNMSGADEMEDMIFGNLDLLWSPVGISNTADHTR